MRLFLCVSAVVLALLAAPASSQPMTRSPQEALAGFDEHVAEILREWNVPGIAVSIVRNGQPVLVKGYGVRDPATGKAMTADTIVPIGSMTKAFTAFSVGLMVDEGKLSFDTPLSTYIPGLRFSDPILTSNLTLRDMLSHRAGFPRHDALWFHNSTIGRDQLIDRLPYLETTQPLRAGFKYNNIMYTLAGITVEKVWGTPWEKLIADRIIQPLHMTRTTFDYDRAVADPDHAGGRETIDGKSIDVGMFKMSSMVNPAGGLYSNARDLTNWLILQLGDGRFEGRQIINPGTLGEMHRSQVVLSNGQRDPEVIPIGYGMGWFTDIYRGHSRIGDPGEITGSTTYISLLPSEHLGVVVLVNHGTSELPEALSREIMDRFLGVSGKDWVGEALKRTRAAEAPASSGPASQPVEIGRSSHPLADYAGDYVSPAYGRLSVTLRSGKLMGRFGDDSTEFTPQQYDVFRASPPSPDNLWRGKRVQFVSDFDGRISGARIPFEPELPPALFLRQPEARLSDPAYLRTLQGTYLLDGDQVIVASSATRLTLKLPNGAPSDLVPSLGGEFIWSRSRDWRIQFQADPDGRVTRMIVITSNGKYTGQRIASPGH